jgi:hypothetical protein
MRYLIILFIVLSSCKSSPGKESELKTFIEIHNEVKLQLTPTMIS